MTYERLDMVSPQTRDLLEEYACAVEAIGEIRETICELAAKSDKEYSVSVMLDGLESVVKTACEAKAALKALGFSENEAYALGMGLKANIIK